MKSKMMPPRDVEKTNSAWERERLWDDDVLESEKSSEGGPIQRFQAT